MQLDALYQEVILDHFKHPRCHGCIESPDACQSLYNPLCGDQVNVAIKLKGDVVEDVRFCGQGCSISQASASMMSDLCRGKSKDEIHKICDSFRELIRGNKSADDVPELGDAVALEGVKKFSARVKCATLAWEAIEKCLA